MQSFCLVGGQEQPGQGARLEDAALSDLLPPSHPGALAAVHGWQYLLSSQDVSECFGHGRHF